MKAFWARVKRTWRAIKIIWVKRQDRAELSSADINMDYFILQLHTRLQEARVRREENANVLHPRTPCNQFGTESYEVIEEAIRRKVAAAIY